MNSLNRITSMPFVYWKSAQEGCRQLGEDWRLPSNEERQKMPALVEDERQFK